MKLEWEILEETEGAWYVRGKEPDRPNAAPIHIASTKLQRMKVQGGWIVERWQDTNVIYHYFIEDPDHLWGEPEEKIEVEDSEVCPKCNEKALVQNEEGAGGRCLACKQRWCEGCGKELTSEDLTEKCLDCGTVNVYKEHR